MNNKKSLDDIKTFPLHEISITEPFTYEINFSPRIIMPLPSPPAHPSVSSSGQVKLPLSSLTSKFLLLITNWDFSKPRSIKSKKVIKGYYYQEYILRKNNQNELEFANAAPENFNWYQTPHIICFAIFSDSNTQTYEIISCHGITPYDAHRVLGIDYVEK